MPVGIPVAPTSTWAIPKVIDVVMVYKPAGSPTFPSSGTGMVGSPGMKGTSNWWDSDTTRPPALAVPAAPLVVSTGSSTRMEIPSAARVASRLFCSVAGVTPNAPVLSPAMWTPLLSMNALTPSTVTWPRVRLAVGVAVVPSEAQAGSCWSIR